jgi:hypothetical protein
VGVWKIWHAAGSGREQQIMLRSLFITTAVYAWGHPALEDYRPELMNEPLVQFHQTVDETLAQAQAGAQTAVVSVGGGELLLYLSSMTELVTHGS